jgi:hypothetical protein
VRLLHDGEVHALAVEASEERSDQLQFLFGLGV